MRSFIAKTLSAAVLASLLCACEQSALSSSGGTYERIEKYETGQISRRFKMVNGKKESIMTDYYNTGEIMAERSFQNNAQHGKTTVYHPSCKIKEVQYFDQGLRVGGDTIFYENGRIQFETTFLAGKKNGYMRKWDSLGNLTYHAKYQMDTGVEIMGKAVRRD